MIHPSGFGGVAFGSAADGDVRTDHGARRTFVAAGAPDRWAYVSQIHGDRIVEATGPGPQGEADAMYITEPGLSVTIATADCVPIVIEADGATAVVHAGWRGAAAGVVPTTLATLREAGHEPRRAAIGPAICGACYEVGAEVSARFPGHISTTTSGTTGVDLQGVVESQLAGLDVWSSDACTFSDHRYNSFRRDATPLRQVAVAWLQPT